VQRIQVALTFESVSVGDWMRQENWLLHKLQGSILLGDGPP
jgi:hypothetical protein